MPRGKGRITSIPPMNSTGEDTTNAATSGSSTTSRELPSDMTFTFNMSSIDQQHRIVVHHRKKDTPRNLPKVIYVTKWITLDFVK